MPGVQLPGVNHVHERRLLDPHEHKSSVLSGHDRRGRRRSYPRPPRQRPGRLIRHIRRHVRRGRRESRSSAELYCVQELQSTDTTPKCENSRYSTGKE